MPTSEVLVAFFLTALVLLLVPGPSVVYSVTRTIEHGRAAGMWSVLGLETGLLIHVLAAACGIAALVAASEAATSVLRLAGAVFLIGLGTLELVRWRPRRPGPESVAEHAGATAAAPVTWSRARMFSDGLLVDLLNPKNCIFFVAFLPQFIDPTREDAGTQTLVLGGLLVALAVVCDGSYALAASRAARRLRSSHTRERARVVAAWVYIGLGGLALAA